MKKRIGKLLAAAGAALCALAACAMPAFAARTHEDLISECTLNDPDNVLSATEQEEVSRAILETSKYIDMYVAVEIRGFDAPQYDDWDVEAMADDIYDQKFNIPYNAETDGVLLFLNMSTHYIYISTCGTGQLYFYNGSADDRVDTIVTEMVDYMRADDYAGGVMDCLDRLKYYYDCGMPENAYAHNEDNGEYIYYQNGTIQHAESLPWWFGVNWQTALPVAGLLGIIAGLISALIVRSRYKLVKSLSPMNYVSQQDTHFYVQDDVFIRAHTSKTYIGDDNRSSGGGGGGGSSHSSGGGFSHGGGGGHW